ncbi:MAG: hypothetical protein JWP12_3202 [Bacteroidetes bacterium]|nr:hypothetical protein [Bacteroidota bacterium]
MRKLILLTTVVICSCHSAVKEDVQLPPISMDSLFNAASAEVEKEAAPIKFTVSQPMQLGAFIVTLAKSSEYKTNNEYTQPSEGMRFYCINVEYSNPTSDLILDANPLQWKLYDSEGYAYEMAIADSKEPELKMASINPGNKLKGWITFEIPKDAKPVKVQFQPDMVNSSNVEIDL